MKQRFKLLEGIAFLRFTIPNLFPTFLVAGLSIVTAVLLCASLGSAVGAESSGSALRIGDRVQTVSQSPVFLTPPYSGRFAGNQPAGMPGTILQGPLRGGETWWWKVHFENGTDGWVAEPQILSTNGQTAASLRSEAIEPDNHTPPSPFAGLSPANGSTVNSSHIILRGTVTSDVYAPALVSFSVDGTNVAINSDGNFSLPLNLHLGINTFTLRASTPNPRQQPNQISSYLDGSVIYGSDATRAAALRLFQGGKLKTSAGDLPPLNTVGLPNANDAHRVPDDQLFLCGDVRANENVELSAIHTLFVREHNQLANAIAASSHGLSDEQIFQRARRIVVAELQVITYNEFLPALLGVNALRPYNGYDPTVNSGIATEFSTAAYRIGHTLINDDVEFLDNDANPVRPEIALADAFFNPDPLKEVGPAPLLKYLATDNAQEVDTQLVGGLRNFLFGPPGAGGFDLASLNLQRGRDHGLADYNSARAAYGLTRLTSFAQITSNLALQAQLASLYGNVDSMDLWVGGLAEDHVRGASVGPTFRKIIANQFERVRDGDQFWYARTFFGPQLNALEQTHLSDIIRRNTTITKIQDNAFFFDPASLPNLQPRPGFLPPALINTKDLQFSVASLDGRGNNSVHPTWGSAGTDLMRYAPAAYGDSLNTPAGVNRPSGRLISNIVCDEPVDIHNSRILSDWIYGWGQFVDHDLDLTTSGNVAFDVQVPLGDPYFDPASTGTAVIYCNRSIYDASTGTSTPNVQEQVYSVNYQPGAGN